MESHTLYIDSCISNCGEEYDAVRTDAKVELYADMEQGALVMRGRKDTLKFGNYCTGMYKKRADGWDFDGVMQSGSGYYWYHNLQFRGDRYMYTHGVRVTNNPELAKQMQAKTQDSRGWEATWEGGVVDGKACVDTPEFHDNAGRIGG